MKKTLLGCCFVLASSIASACPDMFNVSMRQLHSSQMVDLCQLVDNKAILIVNTASHCGFTPQFKGLEKLHQQYRDKGLVVIGFASNDFRQESDDEAESAGICYENYGVSFTMLAPSHVKGKQANPVFSQLLTQAKAPKWNFNKYLLNQQGQLVEQFGSRTKPNDKKLNQRINSTLLVF